MNQFFNIKRFARLMAYEVKTNYKRYLIAAAVCFAAVFVVTYISIYNYNIGGQLYFYEEYIRSLLICFAGFVAFAGLSFPALASKKNTISYLMLPASAFEKYTAEFILRIISGGILFLLIFWVSANCAAEVKAFIYNLEHHTNFSVNHLSLIKLLKTIFLIKTNNDINPSCYSSSDYWSIVFVKMTCITLIIFAFSVRLFFKRFALVKTTAVGIGIVLGVIWILFNFASDFINKYFLKNDLQSAVFNHYLLIILLVFCVILLLTGYYKLKEKKI
ncbi:MAG: hypothetical protein FWF72_00885 [Paludibacter sp.]|nr:hypothetical protein [Paludibacter sp.]